MEALRRLMVVGAMPGNLGMRVAEEAQRSKTWDSVRAYDIKGGEPLTRVAYLDLWSRRKVIEALETLSPTDIICTAGVNLTDGNGVDVAQSIKTHMNINVTGPMQLLSEALDLWLNRWGHVKAIPNSGFNFVAVSSNSAHIARSQSTGYCASKAALSMALRCVARREAGYGIKIWGYEPGFLNDTPMSNATAEQFPDQPLHRIPGGFGIDTDDLADRIVSDMIVSPTGINGCMIRFDGGEQ